MLSSSSADAAVPHAGAAFDYARATQGRTCHLALWGEIDLAAMPTLEHEIDVALDGTIQWFVFDLSAVTFVDSSGLATILRAHERCQREGVQLRILRGPETVQRMFALTGVEDRLPFVPAVPADRRGA